MIDRRLVQIYRLSTMFLLLPCSVFVVSSGTQPRGPPASRLWSKQIKKKDEHDHHGLARDIPPRHSAANPGETNLCFEIEHDACCSSILHLICRCVDKLAAHFWIALTSSSRIHNSSPWPDVNTSFTMVGDFWNRPTSLIQR
jgi:hypothetical protein